MSTGGVCAVPFGPLLCGLPLAGGTPEEWEHFKKCPLHTGRDTPTCPSPAETLRQHEGWPTHSHAHQATQHLFRDPLVKEATVRGALTQALHRHLTKHTESPMQAAAGICSFAWNSWICARLSVSPSTRARCWMGLGYWYALSWDE